MSPVLESLQRAFKPENAAPLGLTFILYFGCVKFSQYILVAGHTAPALIWPAAAVALSAVVLWGFDVWPAIALAAFLGSITNSSPLLVALAVGVSNTLQPLVGAYILRRLKFNLLLAHMRDMLLLIFVALLVTTIVPSITLLAQYTQQIFFEPAYNITFQWGWYWAGEVLSVLILAPFLIRWLGKPAFSRRTQLEWFEIFIVFVILLGIDYFLFWTPTSALAGTTLVILLLVPLMWMALRVGPRFMTLALFLTTVIALSGAVFGQHTNVQPISTRLASSEIFLEILAFVFLIIVAAIEERKNTSKQLREHVLELENAYSKIRFEDAAKAEFLAILAHELRNPLAPLFSSLELLKLQEEVTGEVAELVDVMDQQVRTMGRLLDDLLDVTRVSQKKFQLHRENINLRALIERSLKSTESLLSNRKHTLTVTLPEKSLKVSVDPLRFEQIVANLLTNAAKYTPPGGKINLSVETEGSYLVLRVTDNGIGIPEEMKQKIFEPFMQLEQGGRFRSTGLGIGLSLTKHLVEMHGGTIEAKSAGIGKGSEFIIYLPLLSTMHATTAMDNESQTPTASPERSKTFKILIVDDNELAAKGMRRLLEYRGHDVTVAYDAAEAFDAVTQFEPDVVLLDIGLPDVNGYEVARRLRESGKEHLLIALSGYGQEEDKRKAREAGFDHHLTKPVAVTDIEKLMSSKNTSVHK